MSDASQSATADKSTESRPDARTPPLDRGLANPERRSNGAPGPWRGLLVMAAGGLISGSLVVGALGMVHKSQPDIAGLQIVAASEVDEAAVSLESGFARTAAEEARQCKQPLAFVTLLVDTGQPPATVRIRSGTYVSPSISLTDAPRRVALPFPAPYPSGQGVIMIEGTAGGLGLWLSPGRHIKALNGSQAIPVRWTPKTPPC